MALNPDEWDVVRARQQEWPVSTVAIANELGVKVYRATNWPDNVNGRIFRSSQFGGKSGFAIEVNGHHPETRRRFTIAHELAHYLLHRDRIGRGVYDDAMYRSGLPTAVEVEANRFAAEILMPRDLIRRAIDEGLKTPEALAAAFNVSEAAMRIRLGLAG